MWIKLFAYYYYYYYRTNNHKNLDDTSDSSRVYPKRYAPHNSESIQSLSLFFFLLAQCKNLQKYNDDRTKVKSEKSELKMKCIWRTKLKVIWDDRLFSFDILLILTSRSFIDRCSRRHWHPLWTLKSIKVLIKFTF